MNIHLLLRINAKIVLPLRYRLILLDKRLNEWSNHSGRLLRVSLLSASVINICDTEASLVALSPIYLLV